MIARLNCIVAMMLCCTAMHAQELIINGSFDEENICTEYTMPCSPAAWQSAAHFPFGYQRAVVKPFKGAHYLPMVVEDVGVLNFRTYWQTRLKCSMQKGAVYKISFYVGAIGSKFIPSNLAILFSATEIVQYKIAPIDKQPSVLLTPSNVSGIKKSEWLMVTVDHTATGEEKFMVIGNFNRDERMTRHKKPVSQKVTYCIDELSVKKIGDSASCGMTPEVTDWLAVKDRHTAPFYQKPVVKKDTPARPPVVVQPPRIDTLVLQDVLFKFDSGNLTPGAAQILDTIVNKLQQTSFKRIRIEGHTDSLGTDAYNLDLSARRARSVMEYLTRKGLASSSVESTGKGEAQPVAGNNTEEGRRRNRRVEILIEY
jgi:outer membrane protein OmpA-like peptidoglycan-associated protein